MLLVLEKLTLLKFTILFLNEFTSGSLSNSSTIKTLFVSFVNIFFDSSFLLLPIFVNKILNSSFYFASSCFSFNDDSIDFFLATDRAKGSTVYYLGYAYPKFKDFDIFEYFLTISEAVFLLGLASFSPDEDFSSF